MQPLSLEIRGVVDVATTQLRESILSGALTPGTLVTEALVSATFGIARPSAKAAIEKIVSEGLLERTAHRSARVRTLDAASVRDIYRTRQRLEGAALRELAAAGTAPAAAQTANDELRSLREAQSTAIVDPDLRFHLAIIDALSSPRMSAMYRGLLSEVRFCMTLVQGKQLLDAELIGEEHERILAALRAGESALAVELLRTHLARAEGLLVDALNEQSD